MTPPPPVGVPLVLALLGLLLAGPAPRVMARQQGFRRAPRAALVVWQSVALSAVVSACAAAPLAAVAALGPTGARAGLAARGAWSAVPVLLLTAPILARLLWSGHVVGTGLRRRRREHRTMVDVLGRPAGSVRVLAHPTPTAYCLPGLRRRVVLSEGAVQTLPPDQLAAVLAHEDAHLRARHDLVLEFFTVLHRSAPAWLRSPSALREVRLLVEVLADRVARRRTGPVAVARALVALAGARHPDTALGASGEAGGLRERLALLAQDDAPAWLSAAMYAFAAGTLAAPAAVIALGLGSMGA